MKAAKLKELQKKKKVIIIDVREPAEIQKFGTVKGAKHVPMGQMFLHAAQGKLPKDKKIVTICRSGRRCQIIARELKSDGFDMDYLEGGILEMPQEDLQNPQEVEPKKVKPTKKPKPKKKVTKSKSKVVKKKASRTKPIKKKSSKRKAAKKKTTKKKSTKKRKK